MLKLKCLGPKDGSSRKIGAKGDKTVVHGSLGILGLKMHTKLDHQAFSKINIGTFEKDAEQRVTRQIDFKLKNIGKESDRRLGEVATSPYNNIDLNEPIVNIGSADGSLKL